MDSINKPVSDQVTVLVFKDNYAARTFHIPLKWISKFGIILGFLASLTLVSTLAALKYFRIASTSRPARVHELEQELLELKSTIKNIETRPLGNIPASTGTSVSINSGSQTAATGQSQANSNNESVDSSVNSMTSGDTDSESLGAGINVRVFPETAQLTQPDPVTLPFSVQSPKVSWKKNTLKLRFALQYTRNDQKSQQGRIVILARGPGLLMGYPNGIFSSRENESLISPSKGEFFSVSRYREVKADFSPLTSSKAIRDLEIFIFSKEGNLLKHQIVSAQSLSPDSNDDTSQSSESDTSESSAGDENDS